MDTPTAPATSARTLGVIFDQNFTLRSHVSMICRSCLYAIAEKDIMKLQRFQKPLAQVVAKSPLSRTVLLCCVLSLVAYENMSNFPSLCMYFQYAE
jgi:hypothetical protein